LTDAVVVASPVDAVAPLASERDKLVVLARGTTGLQIRRTHLALMAICYQGPDDPMTVDSLFEREQRCGRLLSMSDAGSMTL